MLTPEDAASLAGLEPEQKFYTVEMLARRRLTEAWRAAGPNDFPEFDEFDYAVTVQAPSSTNLIMR